LITLLDDGSTENDNRLGAVKDMDYLYARAGIFVMPSRSEGFPNALAEALVAGCCCVSFDNRT
jgi:glycosyltransferase involved in cell wall biosynthesis